MHGVTTKIESEYLVKVERFKYLGIIVLNQKR